MIEYEDLLKQLEQFRKDVIKALATIDVELDTLQKAVLKGAPVNLDTIARLRGVAQGRLSKFEEHRSQELGWLHEIR